MSWLGSLPTGWKAKRLKYVSTINDEALPETTDPDYELLYVDIGSVEATAGIQQKEALLFENAPSRARRIVRDGDTIVSTVRTYLRAIAPIEQPEDNLIVSTGFAVVRPKGIEPKFLGYCLRSSYFIETVVSRSVGVSYPATNPTDILCIEVPLPPRETQQTIADYLDAQTAKIDTLLARKRQFIARLKEKRSALIARTVTRGLPPAAAQAAGLGSHPAMKDSGVEWLGEIPAHWESKRLKFLLTERLQYGANESAELDDPELPRYVRITDIDERDSLRDETFRSLPEEVAKPYLLEDGDILFARSGATSGKTFLYRATWGRCAYAGYLIRARLKQEKLLPSFLRYFTASNNYWQWLATSYIQATIQNVSAEKYADLWLPLPPLEEQQAIAAYLDRETARIDQLAAKVEAAIARLTEYRQALITAAVTGKIDVRARSVG